MTNARRDQDGGMRPDRVGLAVKLDRRTLVSTQHDVNFRLSTVVMDRGVAGDLRQVHRGWQIRPLGEGAAGRAAGAGDPRERWQIDDLGGCWHCVSAGRTSESEVEGRLGIIPHSRKLEKPGRIKSGHSKGTGYSIGTGQGEAVGGLEVIPFSFGPGIFVRDFGFDSNRVLKVERKWTRG